MAFVWGLKNENVKTWSETNYSIYDFVWRTAGNEETSHFYFDLMRRILNIKRSNLSFHKRSKK